MKTLCVSILSTEKLWKHDVFPWFGSVASESKVMNPQKVAEDLRFFNVFFARRTFAMGPRMAQALKNQENSVLFITFYAKIKKTKLFSSLFGAPDRARRALRAHRAPRRPPQQSQKVMKTRCFSILSAKKLWKHTVFQWFGSVASESKVMNQKTVDEHRRFFNVFFARWTFAMGPRMAQALKNQEN